MEKDYLVLKRASANRPSGEWNEDDFDVRLDFHRQATHVTLTGAPKAGHRTCATRRAMTGRPQRQLKPRSIGAFLLLAGEIS
jgi:hypothetical protein